MSYFYLKLPARTLPGLLLLLHLTCAVSLLLQCNFPVKLNFKLGSDTDGSLLEKENLNALYLLIDAAMCKLQASTKCCSVLGGFLYHIKYRYHKFFLKCCGIVLRLHCPLLIKRN